MPRMWLRRVVLSPSLIINFPHRSRVHNKFWNKRKKLTKPFSSSFASLFPHNHLRPLLDLFLPMYLHRYIPESMHVYFLLCVCGMSKILVVPFTFALHPLLFPVGTISQNYRWCAFAVIFCVSVSVVWWWTCSLCFWFALSTSPLNPSAHSLQVICLIGYSPFILALIIYPDMPLRISPWRPSLKGRNTHPPMFAHPFLVQWCLSSNCLRCMLANLWHYSLGSLLIEQFRCPLILSIRFTPTLLSGPPTSLISALLQALSVTTRRVCPNIYRAVENDQK